MNPVWTPKRTHNKLDPRCDTRLYSLYMYRQMLKVSGVAYTNGPQVSIMTYNVLYPSLERHFWHSKEHASIMLRQRVLLAEIGRYNPDILCLQEVPVGDNRKWWETSLFELGYESTFAYVGSPTHGVGICFKHDLFTEVSHYYSNFDGPRDDLHGRSNRVMLMLCLGYTAKFLHGHRAPSRQGLIVGTTHMASASKSPYDRAEKTSFFMRKAKRFADYIRSESQPHFRFYTFLAGDFNAREFDPYYSPLHPETLERRKYDASQWKERVYLEECHKKLQKALVSLYSVAYHLADKEPNVRDLWPFIDHIFVSCEPQSEHVQTMSQLARCGEMKLLALLRVPTRAEVGNTRRSQPVVGECASDHVCLMADLELL